MAIQRSRHTITDAPVDGATLTAREWWGSRQRRYNVALIVAGLVAFACYLAALQHSCANSPDVEVTLFTIAFQGMAYALAMGLANICYELGPALERFVPPASRASYRRLAYCAGVTFSVALPFMVPFMIFLAGCSA